MSAEADLDSASRPLRDVLPRWAHERGLGWSGGWKAKDKVWHYALAATASEPRRIVVLVDEDGSRAVVKVEGERDSVATTPRGLYCALTKRWEQ